MATTEELAEGFHRLFMAYEKAHGSFIPKSLDHKGKMMGDYLTQAGPLTVDLWRGHLDGSGYGVGAIPLFEDNTVLWGAIDIDVKGTDLDELCQKIIDKSLPLVVCSSKSTGAHCYLFLKEPQHAPIVIEQLTVWASELGYVTEGADAQVEIFPKQSKRTDATASGSFINMPYYQGDDSDRAGYTKGQGKIPADKFLAIANAKKTILEEVHRPYLEEKDNELSEQFADGPPCFQRILRQGKMSEGARNEFMYSVGVYYRRKHGENNFENEMVKANFDLLEEPLPASEVGTLYKQVNKKDYEYKCNVNPLCSMCDRKECVKRKYGVGVDDQMKAGVITSLTRYKNGEEYWYIAEIDDRYAIRLDPDDLFERKLFKKKIMTELGFVPPPMAQGRWDQVLDPLLRAQAQVEMAPDFTLEGETTNEIQKFLSSPRRGNDINDVIVSDLPWHDVDEGVIWVSARGIRNYLKQQRIKCESRQVYEFMKKAGGKQKDKRVDGKNKSLWVFPIIQRKDIEKTRVEDLSLKKDAPF